MKGLITLGFGVLHLCENRYSIVLKYEDLCESNVDFDNLENFLGLKLNKKVLDKVINSTKKKLSSEGELRVLSSVIEPLASSLGYSYQE